MLDTTVALNVVKLPFVQQRLQLNLCVGGVILDVIITTFSRDEWQLVLEGLKLKSWESTAAKELLDALTNEENIMVMEAEEV